MAVSKLFWCSRQESILELFIWKIEDQNTALREKCPNTEFFLVCIQFECGKIRTRKNSVFGHFSRSDYNYKGYCSNCNCWIWLLVFVFWSRNGRQAVKVWEDCIETLALPPPREPPLGNENYWNVTSDTKTPIFSVANDAFRFRQHCWFIPYSKKNLDWQGKSF